MSFHLTSKFTGAVYSPTSFPVQDENPSKSTEFTRSLPAPVTPFSLRGLAAHQPDPFFSAPESWRGSAASANMGFDSAVVATTAHRAIFTNLSAEMQALQLTRASATTRPVKEEHRTNFSKRINSLTPMKATQERQKRISSLLLRLHTREFENQTQQVTAGDVQSLPQPSPCPDSSAFTAAIAGEARRTCPQNIKEIYQAARNRRTAFPRKGTQNLHSIKLALNQS